MGAKKMGMVFRRILLILIIVFLIYLIAGAMLPFAKQKRIPEAQLPGPADAAAFYGTGEGTDRALLVEDSTQALAERIRLISGAKERLILTTFDMREGESIQDVAAALMAAADRGVNVRVLADGFSGLSHMEGKPLFYAFSSYPGIEVRLYNKPDLLKPWTCNGRMHDKYVIADDTAYLLGGRNTFDYFLGDYIQEGKSYDREVLIFNSLSQRAESNASETLQSSLFQVEAYFDRIWDQEASVPFHPDSRLQKKKEVGKWVTALRKRYETMQQEHPDWFADNPESLAAHYSAVTVPTRRVTLISGETGILAKRPVVWKQLKNLMMQAEEKVLFQSPYVVLDEEMYADLADLAGGNFDFTLFLNDITVGDNLVASSDYLKNKQKILDTGAQVLEYKGDFSSHGKSILIDGRLSVIGSYNFDMRSTYMDTELMLAIDSEPLAQELQNAMNVFLGQSAWVTTTRWPEMTAGAAWSKRAAWKLIGFFLQPFRYVI